ncbi:SPFH domain / band 7 family domain-containing protein [Ditylenchus destructor]|nr:SPFH domain / band 7 family domain-containing protein [Ditylenchus destructor]
MLPSSRRFSIAAAALLRNTSALRTTLPICNIKCRQYSDTATNTVINFVPQQQAWVVERMGKFYKILEPGVNFLLPVIDKIGYVHSLKEIAIEIPKQEAITVDNVQLHFDAVLYSRVTDAYAASYGVEDPLFAITQLAQTTMRSEVGKINLDTVFKERQTLNIAIVEAMNAAAKPWGIVCLRYEIRTITMPEEIQKAMRMQVEAERKKRATILESEGNRQSNMNVAEGEKQARILRSEADMQEQINSATGVAKAILLEAEARKEALSKISDALNKTGGPNAASLLVAEQYVKAFKNLAKNSNTLIMPANVNDVSQMVTQAMAVYNTISKSPMAVSTEQNNARRITDDK